MDWTRERARDTIDRVLKLAAGGECEVQLEATASSHTRFARNEITTSGHAEDLRLAVTLRREGRSGTVLTNDLSQDGLREAVTRAEATRSVTPPDPEAVELLPPQDYPVVDKHDDRAAAARAADRVSGVKAALREAKGRRLTAAGFFETTAAWRAIGNSRGNFGWARETGTGFTATMRTQDGTGSGWAEAFAPRFDAVDPLAVVRRAARKGAESARPRPLAPGDYTVILEPAAVAALLQTLQFGSLSARAADEGRSPFSKQGGGNRIGETLFHDAVTIRSDPFDVRVPGGPWSGGSGFLGQFAAGSFGLPARRVTWIEKGVLKTLHTDRYWGKVTGTGPTPFPAGIVMEGGTGTIDDLVASTERGLLVTRFWYIRTVNPQTAQVTGLTRDGLFLIEQGKVAGPVVNLRFNESPVVLLQNVEALGAAVPAGRMVLPAVKSRAFTFTSTSDAV